MRRLLLAWRLARYMQENEDRMLDELLRAQLDGRYVTFERGSTLQMLFTLLVQGRKRV